MSTARMVQWIGTLAFVLLSSENLSAELSTNLDELRRMDMRDLVRAYVIDDVSFHLYDQEKGYYIGDIIIRKGEGISASYGGEYIDVQLYSVSYSLDAIDLTVQSRGFWVVKGQRKFTRSFYYRAVVTKEEFISAIEAYLKGEKSGGVIDVPAAMVDLSQAK